MPGDEALFDTSEDRKFLSGSNVYRRGQAGELRCSVESLSFNESWPDSERPSTVE